MNYQWDAADYEKHSPPQQQWARAVIQALKLAGDERILDIGCGDGKVTTELAALVPKGSVLGIDSSESMIEFAHQRFPPHISLTCDFTRVTPRTSRIVTSSTLLCRLLAFIG